MTQTKHKFKIGDLVQRKKNWHPHWGIGIIIAIDPKQDTLGPAYQVYWTKQGLDLNYEKRLEEVSK